MKTNACLRLHSKLINAKMSIRRPPFGFLLVIVYLVADQLARLNECQNINYPSQLSMQFQQAAQNANKHANYRPPVVQANGNATTRSTVNTAPIKNNTLDLTNTAADWFMMGGGDVGESSQDTIMTSEGKNVASFADASGRNSTKKSTAHKRKGSNKAKTPPSNRTATFDDEQSDSSDSNEIFDDVEDGSLSGNQKEPECASRGRYYCTYKEDYPLKLVTEVTKYYKWPLEKLFRDLHAQIMPKLAQDSTGNLVCDSITRVVRPGWARNTNERWLVVINTENYHQYVTEVVCQYGSNSRCNFIPPCYYSSCQQRYNTQKLLVIDPTNPYRGPFLSEFLFPSCCVCYVPTSSDTFQDKYRSSPSTIYQRTMQQESANNLYPPQFRPVGVVEEQPASLVEQSQVSSSRSASSSSMGGKSSSQLALGPGEIRRDGEVYSRRPDAKQSRRTDSTPSSPSSHESNPDGPMEFPRLGLPESLTDPAQSSAKNEQQ